MQSAVQGEEKVDEIECKVFIKWSDSSLLSICRELVLRDGPCSEENAAEFTLKPVEWRTCRRVGQTFNRLSRGREKKERGESESNQSSLWLCSRKRPIRVQSKSPLGISEITYSNSQVQTVEINFIIVSSAVALLGRQKSWFKIMTHSMFDLFSYGSCVTSKPEDIYRY